MFNPGLAGLTSGSAPGVGPATNSGSHCALVPCMFNTHLVTASSNSLNITVCINLYVQNQFPPM